MADLKRATKAARQGGVAAVACFVREHWQGDPDRLVNKNDDTLLLLAARHSQAGVVKVLLERALSQTSAQSRCLSLPQPSPLTTFAIKDRQLSRAAPR